MIETDTTTYYYHDAVWLWYHFEYSKTCPEDLQRISPIKKAILKKLDFLPFIEYVPSVKPTPSAKPLLDELFIYESIVDDHVDFELIDEQNDDEKGLLRFRGFLKGRIDQIVLKKS